MSDIKLPLRILIVDDSADDAALLVHELRKCGYEPAFERVETAGAMRAALRDKPWDFIVSDYLIPGFGGLAAVGIAKESGLDLPFVVISGKVGEETLVEVMRAGASDFLIKGRLARLGLVIKRELADAAARRGLRQAQIEWRAAFDSVRDAIFLHDAAFRVVRANAAYAMLAGMPVEETAGKPYWEVFPKLGGPLPNCRAGTEPKSWHEEEFTLPDGRAYLSRSSPIADESGAYLYSLHVLQDVTVRNQLEARLRDLSLVDGLTGIANRRRFDEVLLREWARARRDGRPLSLLMVDVDHFKDYNDRYGHPAGDACLQQIAMAIDGIAHRAADQTARYGGEEFAVILPNADAATAATMAEKIRAGVAALGRPHEASDTAAFVTISIGVATTIPAQASNAANLVAAADKALYEAKRSGRNRVVAFDAVTRMTLEAAG